MMEFHLTSGVAIQISETKIEIDRNSGKAALKGLFAGRAMGKMVIKNASVTGVIYNADYLIICASGLPTPNDFKISSIAEVKQYPNCIVGKPEELVELYEALNNLL